jgi:streptogramin lyase
MQDTAHPTDIAHTNGRVWPTLGPVDWNRNGETTDTCVRYNLDGDVGGVLNVDHGADDWAWLHSRLTPPAINDVSLDGNVVTVTGANLIGPPRVFFSGGVEGAISDFRYDLSPDTSFRVEVPVGAKSGPITVVTPDGTVTGAQSLTITGHATGSGDIASGPGDTVWFTEPDGNGIGRVDPNGTITQFPLPTVGGDPYGITAGPDGNMWFTEPQANAIGRITPTGAVTTFLVPTAASRPFGITAGPDGNLWFTEEASGKIGRITPDGTINEFLGPLLTVNGFVTLNLRAITSADGALWFTAGSPITQNECSPQRGCATMHVDLGRIDPTGAFSLYGTRYPVSAITAVNPFGTLWLTDSQGLMRTSAFLIGSTDDLDTEEELPIGAPSVGYFALGEDPNEFVWFPEFAAGLIGRQHFLDLTQFTLPAISPDETAAITAAPDGNAWFTEDTAHKIGRITPTGAITEYPIP